MNKNIRDFINYLLIGVVGFLPILLVLQIIIYIQRFLRDFVLMVHGRYENPLVTMALFLIALAILAYFGRLLKQDKAYLLYYFERFIQKIPVIGSIYRVSRKLLQLFLSKDDNQVTEVVFVEYPKDGMWCLLM